MGLRTAQHIAELKNDPIESLYISNMSIIKRIHVIIILNIAFLFDSNDIFY